MSVRRVPNLRLSERLAGCPLPYATRYAICIGHLLPSGDYPI